MSKKVAIAGITIQFKGIPEIQMTVEEAKQLYSELHEIFGEKIYLNALNSTSPAPVYVMDSSKVVFRGQEQKGTAENPDANRNTVYCGNKGKK